MWHLGDCHMEPTLKDEQLVKGPIDHTHRPWFASRHDAHDPRELRTPAFLWNAKSTVVAGTRLVASHTMSCGAKIRQEPGFSNPMDLSPLEILCTLKYCIWDRSYGADLPETRRSKPMAAVHMNHSNIPSKTCVRRLFWELLMMV